MDVADVTPPPGHSTAPTRPFAGAVNLRRRVFQIHSKSAGRVHRIHGARHALIGAALATSGMSAWSAGSASWPDAIGLIGGIGVLGAFLASLRRVGTRMRILRKDDQEVWLDCADALNAAELLEAVAVASVPSLAARDR